MPLDQLMAPSCHPLPEATTYFLQEQPQLIERVLKCPTGQGRDSTKGFIKVTLKSQLGCPELRVGSQLGVQFGSNGALVIRFLFKWLETAFGILWEMPLVCKISWVSICGDSLLKVGNPPDPGESEIWSYRKGPLCHRYSRLDVLPLDVGAPQMLEQPVSQPTVAGLQKGPLGLFT